MHFVFKCYHPYKTRNYSDTAYVENKPYVYIKQVNMV